MKKLKLFYNPFSGNKSFKFDLDVCIGIFQEGGYEVHPFRTLHPGDIDTHIATMDPNYDIIVASGGDGTVNIVLNAMMRRGLHIPLGIIPSGTANDFATYLGFKSGEVEDVCRTIVSTKPVDIDLGLVNDSIFFINVCAGGFFTNVSHFVLSVVLQQHRLSTVSLPFQKRFRTSRSNFHILPFSRLFVLFVRIIPVIFRYSVQFSAFFQALSPLLTGPKKCDIPKS